MGKGRQGNAHGQSVVIPALVWHFRMYNSGSATTWCRNNLNTPRAKLKFMAQIKCILIARLQVKYVNLNTPFYLITVIALLPYYPLLPYYHLRYRIYCTLIYFTAARSLTCCLLSSETLDRTQLKELDSCVCNVSAPTDIQLKRESFPSTIRQVQTNRSGLRRGFVICNTRFT